ncbi:hypothetical protein [Pasteuria penetrans]|uniref:hypothetical protein n=1 Tax=Pasteuria penetrans TaxID=86005 RepID=UPI0011EC7998|nr:hypothetical protein [Pasteuria penetrans]
MEMVQQVEYFVIGSHVHNLPEFKRLRPIACVCVKKVTQGTKGVWPFDLVLRFGPSKRAGR